MRKHNYKGKDLLDNGFLPESYVELHGHDIVDDVGNQTILQRNVYAALRLNADKDAGKPTKDASGYKSEIGALEVYNEDLGNFIAACISGEEVREEEAPKNPEPAPEEEEPTPSFTPLQSPNI